MKRIFLFLLMFFVSFPVFAGYRGTKIVTTFPPIQSLVWGVTDGVMPVNLMFSKPLEDHHSIQLKPSQMKILQGADIVFYSSDDLESFMKDAIKAVAPNAKVFCLADEIPDLVFLPSVLNPEKKDLHYWLDYRNALLMTDKIAEIMIEQDPKNKEKYLANAKRSKDFINQLPFLDSRPEKGKKFVAFHGGFDYLANSLDLNIKTFVADIQNIDTPRVYNEIKKRIQQEDADCFLVDPQTDKRRLKSLDLNGNNVIKMDAFGWNVSGGIGQYYRMMGRILDRMAKCKAKR